MSCNAGPNYCIPRATTKNIPLTVTKADGSAEDLTDWVITFSAKRNIDQPLRDIEVTADIIGDPTNGEAVISLLITDTDITHGELTYNVEFRNDDDSIVQSWEGEIEIEQRT